MSNTFAIKYDGLAASEHAIEMRRFGEAIVGLDKVINAGLVALLEFRVPKKGERFPLVIRAQEPQRGSVELFGEVAQTVKPVGSILPLVHEMFYTGAGDVIWRWLSWTMNMSGGREKEADPHFLALMDLTREIHKGRAESEEAN